MMKTPLKWLAALALSAMVLTGCAAPSASKQALPPWATPYAQMEYQRPDPQALKELAQAVVEKTAVSEALEALDEFNAALDRFYTDSALAEIRSSGNLTDAYWAEENEYCFSVSTQAEQIQESMLRALAASPLRQELEEARFGVGYFQAYDQEAFYSPALMALFQEESRLQAQYYSLQDTPFPVGSPQFYNQCADTMADTLVELIRVRQEIANETGFNDYPSFANAYYFYREYTPDMAASYLADVQQELVPLYRQYVSLSQSAEKCSEKEMLDYVEQTAAFLGGTVRDAFTLMQQAGLYDITRSTRKYDSSFEIYLYSYQEPFVFLNPTRTVWDKLTLTHEFGHFCNDYASGGSVSGIDVMEIFSQGLEYLSLCGRQQDSAMVRLKLADSLATFVEQGCYAEFEQRIYQLTGEDLNREALYRLYEETAKAYGLDGPGFDRREFVSINHFYTNPMYVISYVFSNDAAMQFYDLEHTAPGQGTALYLSLLDREADYFLSFLEEAGLENPFAPGRVQHIRQDLENGLGN